MKTNPCRTCSKPGLVIVDFNGRIREEGPRRRYKVICDTDGCWVGPLCDTEFTAVTEWNKSMSTKTDPNVCSPI